MHLLLIKTSSMGDVIHTLPALTDAMQALPGICVDWVAEENFAQIPGWHPAVDRVIPVAIRRWRKAWFSAPIRAERLAFRQLLQSRHYDAVIDAQGLLKSAVLIARYARGVRHGMSWRSAREPLASLFYQCRHTIPCAQHAVERCRMLLAYSLGYSQPQQQGDYAIARHFTAQQTTHSGNYLVFLHATTRAEKHWPETHWRALIAWIAAHTDWRIKLPWGTSLEQQRAQRLAQDFSHVDVLPHLSLAEIAGVLAAARQIVSVDTGLSHLAAALNRPNVTLYGPTDPGLIGGYGQHQQAIVSPTRSLADISYLMVAKRLSAVM